MPLAELDAEASHWRELIRLGRYCGCPPWEMEEMPVLWRDRLRLSILMDDRLEVAAIEDPKQRAKAMRRLPRIPPPEGI